MPRGLKACEFLSNSTIGVSKSNVASSARCSATPSPCGVPRTLMPWFELLPSNVEESPVFISTRTWFGRSGVDLQRIPLAVHVARAVVVDLGDGFEALFERLAEGVVLDEVDFLGDRNGLFVFVRGQSGLIRAVNRLTGYFGGVGVVYRRAPACGIVATRTRRTWR